MKGGEILIKSLIDSGVKDIFGIPGGAVLPIFDVLYEYMNSGKINFYLMRHEQGAAHAADGYSRSSGKPGIVLVTSGPGATNTVTGIATAYMDSVPIVVFTGQVATNLIGNDAFQEVNTTGITYSITKHNYLVKEINELERIVKEAIYIATTGRPGPVVVDIPVNISRSEGEYKNIKDINLRSYRPVYEGHEGQIKKAAKLIMESKRPIIYAGGGIIISGAHNELKTLAEKTGIPVTLTLMGLGGFPSEHPLFLGMLGMHGTKTANIAISEADLIIAVGARFDDRVTGKLEEFAPYAKIIHIDIDPSSIGKNVDIEVPIVGDAKRILQKLLKYVNKCDIKEWVDYIMKLKEENPLGYEKSDTKIKPQYVIEVLYELTNGDAIITTEVGQNQMWAAQFYKFKRIRQFLTSGGLGTMGYGFPAAIGAQVANPDATVVDIAGDGSIQMNIQELATVASYNLPVKIIILNNYYLGMVRQWQQLFFERKYSATCLGRRVGKCPDPCPGPGPHCPDYIPNIEKLAEAYDIKGYIIDKPSDVKPVLKEALKLKGPVIMDFRIEPEENVFPMVPAGAPLKQMLDRPLA